jgi:hypothetical protein
MVSVLEYGWQAQFHALAQAYGFKKRPRAYAVSEFSGR